MNIKRTSSLLFAGLGAMLIVSASVAQEITVPLYKTGNVLAVGVYNDSTTSSDLIVSAELTDNNGVKYVGGELGTWVNGTDFKYKVVYFDDGSGEEVPGWQQRGFDDSSWILDTTLGFPIGHGTSAEEGRFDLPLETSDETVYTRSVFDAQNYASISQLTIKIAGDDGAVAWFNGVYIGFSGNGVTDGGEAVEDSVYNTGIDGGSGGAWDGGDPFAFTGTGTAQFTVNVDLVEGPVPLYKSGNVLAVGVYNDSTTSSDLIVSAELTDNNGVKYVGGELGTWVDGTDFRYKVVYFDDGSGAEEPGWQLRGYDDSSWILDTTLGFPIGHGTSNEEGRFDLPLQTSDETVYTRSTFDAQNYGSISQLTIKIAGDDGAVAWFNGRYIGFSGNGVTDGGEAVEDSVYNTGIDGGSGGAWDEGDPFAFTGTGTAQFTIDIVLADGASSVGTWELFK